MNLDDYVDMNGAVYDADNDQITISTWIKANEFSSSLNIAGVRSEPNSGYIFGIAGQLAGDPLFFTLFGSVDEVSSASGVIAGKWAYVSVTYDKQNIKFYVDGNHISSHSQVGDVFPPTRDLFVGALNSYGTAVSFFDGQIDDVKIYNYARTQAQIAWDYNKGAPIAHWKFDEESSGSADGESLIDSLGNGNVGTGVDGGNDTGLNWASGKRGNAIDFDGVDDYVSTVDINIAQDITISAWIKADTIAGGQRIVSKWGDTSPERSYLLATDGTNINEFTFSVYDGTNFEVCDSNAVSGTYRIDNWYHVLGFIME